MPLMLAWPTRSTERSIEKGGLAFPPAGSSARRTVIGQNNNDNMPVNRATHGGSLRPVRLSCKLMVNLLDTSTPAPKGLNVSWS